MSAYNSLELRFIEYSLDNYLDIFNELVAMGKKNFLIRGMNQDSIQFLMKAKTLNSSRSINFYAYPDSSDMPHPEDIICEFAIDDIDAVLIFIKDAIQLSQTLVDYVNLQDCIIIAPITEHYYKNRPVFINSVPKSGTHLLFECVRTFGFANPPTLDLPDYHDNFQPGHFYNLQHITTDYLSLLYPHISKFLDSFCNSVVLFIYRDPRDIAVSLSYYLASQKDYHILCSYMKTLSPEARLSAVIKGEYPIPVYINRHANFSCNIRDLLLLWADWLKYPFSNLIRFRFEDIVGPKGGGNLDFQLHSLWRLQLGLHVPGKPTDYAEKIFSEQALTFRKGQIGSYKENFTEEHVNLFKSLPQDFMEIYGYETQLEVEKRCKSNEYCFTGSISIEKVLWPYLIEENYKGFNILLYEGKFYALAQDLGSVNLAQVRVYQEYGKCVIGNSLREIKYLVSQKEIEARSAEIKQLKKEIAELRLDAAYAHNKLGQALYRAGQIEAVEEVFLKAYALAPDSAEVHNSLAVFYWEQGNPEKAIEHMRQAMQLEPQNPDVVVNCAVMQEAVGETEQAIQMLEEYLVTNEDEGIQKELERMRQKVRSCPE